MRASTAGRVVQVDRRGSRTLCGEVGRLPPAIDDGGDLSAYGLATRPRQPADEPAHGSRGAQLLRRDLRDDMAGGEVGLGADRRLVVGVPGTARQEEGDAQHSHIEQATHIHKRKREMGIWLTVSFLPVVATPMA